MLTVLLLALPLPQAEAPPPRPRLQPPAGQERAEPGTQRPRVREFLRHHPRLRAELFERGRAQDFWREHPRFRAEAVDRLRERGFQRGRPETQPEPQTGRERAAPGRDREREGFGRGRAPDSWREHPRFRAETFDRLRERGFDRRRPEAPPEPQTGRLRERLEQLDRDQLIELLLRRAGESGAAADAPRRTWRT